MTITLTRDEAQQVLDALQCATPPTFSAKIVEDWQSAVEFLRARLSAPEPEPVAWVPVHPKNGPLWSMTTDAPSPERLPNYSLMSLYPAPLSTPDSANRSADSAGAFCNQEPVAWLHRFIEHGISIGKKPVDLDKYPDRWMPVYANPTAFDIIKSPFHQLTDISNRMGSAHLSFPAQPSPLKWIGLGLQTLHIATLGAMS